MTKRTKKKQVKKIQKPICGVVMPISSIDGCTETHWSDVLEIITESIEEAGFESNLVSNSDDVGVIQKRIVQNLYDNPVVVCDVSGKNPNVMFELGLRLAFDKPTIILKDDKTTYSFDTSPIEHLEYPRDLRFGTMVDFKAKLTDKIKGTHEKFKTDASFSTFLKHFGEFKVAKLDKKEVPEQEYIIEELNALKNLILENSTKTYRPSIVYSERKLMDICLKDITTSTLKNITSILSDVIGIKTTRIIQRGPRHSHIYAYPDPEANLDELKMKIQKLIGPRFPIRLR